MPRVPRPSKPPSGPIAISTAAPMRCHGAVRTGARARAAAARPPAANLPDSRSSGRGASMTGRRLRPHCSQALHGDRAPVRGLGCRLRRRRAAPRCARLRTGTMRATPSSVAFCTMTSMRSARAMHCTRVTASGDSRSTLAPVAHRRRDPRAADALDARRRTRGRRRRTARAHRRCAARSTLARWARGDGRQLDDAAGSESAST